MLQIHYNERPLRSTLRSETVAMITMVYARIDVKKALNRLFLPRSALQTSCRNMRKALSPAECSAVHAIHPFQFSHVAFTMHHVPAATILPLRQQQMQDSDQTTRRLQTCDSAVWEAFLSHRLDIADLHVTHVSAEQIERQRTRYVIQLAGHSDPITLLGKRTTPLEARFYRHFADAYRRLRHVVGSVRPIRSRAGS